MNYVPTFNPPFALPRNSEWTEARVKRLRELAGEGKSAGQMGASMGITRNAVIGKLGRLGVNLGPVWTPEMEAELRRHIDGGLSASLAAPQLGVSRRAALAKAFRLGIRFRGEIAKNRVRMYPERSIRKAPSIPKPTLICESLNIKLEDIDSHQCRYIPDDVKGSDTLYCGLQTLTGQPWCGFHYRATHDSVPVRNVPAIVPAEGEAA